jgi:hypothetical protein
VRRPLVGDGVPVKIPFFVCILQEAEPGGVRVAQRQGGISEFLQNAVRRVAISCAKATRARFSAA